MPSSTTSFLDRFLRSVSDFPEKTAIVFEEKKLSYQELNKKSDLLSQFLLSKGIGRGDIVPIILERGFDAIISMIAVLKTDAAFCNISVDYPKERIDFIIKDTKAKIIIDKQFLQYHDAPHKKNEREGKEFDQPPPRSMSGGGRGGYFCILHSHFCFL